MLEERKVCTTIFLDVKQAFDKVWKKGLMKNLHKLLPKQYCQILGSYISGRLFRIKEGSKSFEAQRDKRGSDLWNTAAGFCQQE
jgi:hypothetical protein